MIYTYISVIQDHLHANSKSVFNVRVMANSAVFVRKAISFSLEPVLNFNTDQNL